MESLFSDYLENITDDAKDEAIKRHEGQTRKDGSPYVSHPIAVADIVKKYKKSHKLDELLAAAYLHDTLEDTDLSPELLRKTFGDLIYEIVEELTSNPKHVKLQGKTNYLINKMTNMSSWALVIKLADRLHNTSDLNTASFEFRKRYRIETKKILSALEINRKLTRTQKILINKIKENLYNTISFL